MLVVLIQFGLSESMRTPTRPEAASHGSRWRLAAGTGWPAGRINRRALRTEIEFMAVVSGLAPVAPPCGGSRPDARLIQTGPRFARLRPARRLSPALAPRAAFRPSNSWGVSAVVIVTSGQPRSESQGCHDRTGDRVDWLPAAQPWPSRTRPFPCPARGPPRRPIPEPACS